LYHVLNRGNYRSSIFADEGVYDTAAHGVGKPASVTHAATVNGVAQIPVAEEDKGVRSEWR
jgi:hypothetical protein